MKFKRKIVRKYLLYAFVAYPCHNLKKSLDENVANNLSCNCLIMCENISILLTGLKDWLEAFFQLADISANREQGHPVYSYTVDQSELSIWILDQSELCIWILDQSELCNWILDQWDSWIWIFDQSELGSWILDPMNAGSRPTSTGSSGPRAGISPSMLHEKS